MIKMTVLYQKPQDPDAFEKHYLDVHLPIVKSYENLKEVSFAKVTRVLSGDYPYAYQFTGTWADKDGWKADMNSQAAADATVDAKSFAPAFDVVVWEDLV